MKKFLGLVFALAMIFSVVSIGDAQTVRVKRKRHHGVATKTWHGTKKVWHKTVKGTRYVTHKTKRGTQKTYSKSKRVTKRIFHKTKRAVQ